MFGGRPNLMTFLRILELIRNRSSQPPRQHNAQTYLYLFYHKFDSLLSALSVTIHTCACLVSVSTVLNTLFALTVVMNTTLNYLSPGNIALRLRSSHVKSTSKSLCLPMIAQSASLTSWLVQNIFVTRFTSQSVIIRYDDRQARTVIG